MNDGKEQSRLERNARVRSAAALAIASTLLWGCCVLGRPGAPGTSIGEPIYYNGKLEQTLKVSMPAVYEASITMLKDLDLPIIEERADVRSGLLRSESAGGKPIRIELEALEVYTRVTIRAGLAGDRELALLILKEIKDRL